MPASLKDKKENNAMLKEKRSLWIFVACGIAVALVGGMITLNLLESRTQTDTYLSLLSPKLLRGTEIGSESAPVDIEEYSDFQCSYCAKFARETFPVLVSEFISSGKVRFVFHQFPVYGQESIWAAEASLAAADQGKFWEYQNLLYSKFIGENKGTFTLEMLKLYARDIGLDEEKFNADMDSRKFLTRITDDIAQGIALNISKTPTFVINGKQLPGAVSITDFRRLIAALLENK
jgi:protein-disulfide isomerase